jgi:hypothetical protein
VWTIVFATAGITFGLLACAAAGAVCGFWEWPPRPSSEFGVACGVLGGAIILFEMAILPRKWLRGRPLGATAIWMRFHIWFGIISLPIVVIHSGFRFGAPLPTFTLLLFLAVIASGLWGHIMQQWLPWRILVDVPNETIASQVDFAGEQHAEEAARLIAELIGPAGDAEEPAFADQSCIATQTLVTGQTVVDLRQFAETLLLPYLRHGQSSRSPLAARAETERRFAEFRDLTPDEAHAVLDRLELLCGLRRQWDSLARLNFWLHNWLVLHLPLSVTMTGFMLIHALRALKYW